MAQATKAAYYGALKGVGVEFEKHYRDYTTEELRQGWEAYAEAHGLPLVPDGAEEESDLPGPREDSAAELKEQIAQLTSLIGGLAQEVSSLKAPKPVPTEHPREVSELDPSQHAGATLNTPSDEGVIKVDEHGNQWYQIEVPKPGYPKPRGRRVLRYNDPGVRTEKIKVGDYEETFEVAGDGSRSVPAEIKITLPSYQTGIFKAPNMPFKIHTYNGVRGFDLEDVQAYFGGNDLVPDTVKRTYVSNDLCYDITTTIRTIEDEYRLRVLKTGR